MPLNTCRTLLGLKCPDATVGTRTVTCDKRHASWIFNDPHCDALRPARRKVWYAGIAFQPNLDRG